MAVRIIIVENNRSIAQDLQQRLLKFGYDVVGICASSQEALQSITTLAPDMIIMNTRLQQEADGIEIAELVQKKHNTPIIYMAETVGQTIPRRANSTGPFGYVFIPFTDRQIITTLEIAYLRNQFEIEIQESQRWLSGILNGIADGVIAIDAQKQIRYINQVAQRLIGCNEKEAIGRTIHDILVLIDEKTAAPIELWSSNNAPTGNQRQPPCRF